MNVDFQQLKDMGIVGAVFFFIFKQLWGWIIGSAKIRLKTLSENTEALVKMDAKLDKINKDMMVAFANIKEIREKNSMGPIPRDQ